MLLQCPKVCFRWRILHPQLFNIRQHPRTNKCSADHRCSVSGWATLSPFRSIILILSPPLSHFLNMNFLFHLPLGKEREGSQGMLERQSEGDWKYSVFGSIKPAGFDSQNQQSHFHCNSLFRAMEAASVFHRFS